MICHSTYHPQVPITVVHVMVKFCHQCQAFVLAGGATTTEGDALIIDEPLNEVEFGPFDSLDDIALAAAQRICDLLASPGRPWVASVHP